MTPPVRDKLEPAKVDKPDSLRKARLRVAAAVASALLISVAIYAVMGLDTGTTVNVTSIELNIGYNSPSDTYFGHSVQNVTAGYQTYSGGEIISYTFQFHNYGNMDHYVITLSTSTQGFTVVPNGTDYPVSVTPGQTVHVDLFLKTPSSDFAGKLYVTAVVQ